MKYSLKNMEDHDYDSINGEYGKKAKMAILNKLKLSSFEMDQLFLDF